MRGYEYQGRGGDVGRYGSATATRLARRAVEAAAPHELPQFPMTAEAFHRSSAKDWMWPVRRDEPLAIGLDVVAALISTAALSAAVQVLDHLAQQSTAEAVDTTRNRLLPRLLRRRARRALEPAAEPAAAPVEEERLTAEQLTRLREVAKRAALRWRVPEAQAQAIADGIVAELATLSPERPDAGEPGGEGPAEAARR
ncbi:hypothetical protein [Streptomyces sp. TLI_105]|uniref:hypothetical protein n=1 Tax=Streptomyces sp. TLI_105 TaxID=1881019 RepID=UPI00089ABDF9|nr:hypothetical protein [Streptomyces sp. TLI_105]SEB84578.1 hypothetical protein SAMN05428939_0881 [Streptomyces sp. TLI_105]